MTALAAQQPTEWAAPVPPEMAAFDWQRPEYTPIILERMKRLQKLRERP